jgi:hypothetical protein
MRESEFTNHARSCQLNPQNTEPAKQNAAGVRQLHPSVTPKAFANFSPVVGAQRQPWVSNQKTDETLKAFALKTNPFRVE